VKILKPYWTANFINLNLQSTRWPINLIRKLKKGVMLVKKREYIFSNYVENLISLHTSSNLLKNKERITDG